MTNKYELRKIHKKIRNELDIETISDLIVQNLFDLDCFMRAENIFSYISFGSEIKTDKILSLHDKNIFVPKLCGENMIMVPYEKDSLSENKFGIMEPMSDFSVLPQQNDIIIVPALCVDKNFNRLGYGGGYYDRFLKNLSAKKIVPISKKLITSEIETDVFDQKVDIIVTEEAVYFRENP